MKIFLVGMPGSGKTTIGKELASALNLPFIDLDEEIEKHEGKKITEIFSAEGEDYFRRVESKLLREHATVQNSFILSTGGGAPCFFQGMDVLNENGLTIFLNTPLATILERIQNNSNRPLLSQDTSREQRLKDLFDKRFPVYSRAQLVVDDPSLEKIVAALRVKGLVG